MGAQAPLITGISGIRGLVGQSFTGEVVAQFASAFAATLPAGARVLLARDTRPSGRDFARVAAAALCAAGCRVFDLGVCATPTAKLMVGELAAQGALIITASHNPAPWNGLKLVREDGVFLDAAQGARVEEIRRRRAFRRAAGGQLESVDAAECCSRHLQRLLAHIEVAAIRRARLAVAVDPCNGTGALLLPALFEALGVEAHFINAEPNGQFAHEPEPVPAHLGQLGEAVRRTGSAVGFAIDPDADRVTLVDAGGEPVGEDSTLALAVQAVTARRPGPVVTTLSTSQAVSDVAAARACPVLLTPVGEVHVVEKMLAAGAAIGGEGNGGVILGQVGPGRDAAVGVALVLEAMAGRGRTLAQLLAELPTYAIEKRKVSCSPEELQRTLAILLARHPGAYVHPVRDGSKLYLSGRLQCPWIHVRASNTEPVARIIAEADSAAQARALCDEVERALAASREG